MDDFIDISRKLENKNKYIAFNMRTDKLKNLCFRYQNFCKDLNKKSS